MLCADLGFEWENLSGDTRAALALDLVEAMERRDMVQDLLAAMQRARPRMTFSYDPTLDR